MSFQQGLSGLNAASKNLDVIGNNIANTNTVGAKTSRAEFADLYANSLYSSNATPGIGTQVAAISQQFSQGDLASTSNPLDVAINGTGFFRMSQGGTTEFTRNGQFKLDKDGYIVNAQGARLTGYTADADGRPANGTPTDLRLSLADLPPRATESGLVGMNLDARNVAATVPFDLEDAASYSGATTMSVYDSLGREHPLSLYARKTADNAWDLFATADGNLVSPTAVGNLTFDTEGRLTGGSPLNIAVPVGADAGGAQNVSINLSRVTQFGSAFSVTELTQDGASAGRLSGFAIGQDGLIQSRYSNGQFLTQAQVVLANFVNPQGLNPLGGNAWAETSASGQPLVGAPASGNLGVLQSGAVENSNVDLTAELVNMITAQRVYQANAQTVRTQDQVLQTLVNLR